MVVGCTMGDGGVMHIPWAYIGDFAQRIGSSYDLLYTTIN